MVSRASTNQRLAVLARIDLPDALESGLAPRSLRIIPAVNPRDASIVNVSIERDVSIAAVFPQIRRG